MKVVVIGGTGLIGSELVRELKLAGHDGIAASPSTGVDTITGRGLGPVLDGADVVVDASSPGYFDPAEMERFFEASAANLLTAEREAGIRHHVTLSAVGAGRVATGYFVAKAAQERRVAGSAIPFSIVRSTPVFEYIYNIVSAAGEGSVLRLPPILIRPIAAHDLAKALLRVALAEPVNGIIEVAGPLTYALTALAEEVLTAFEDSRVILADDSAPYFGARVDGDSLTGRDPLTATITFEDWLRQALIPA